MMERGEGRWVHRASSMPDKGVRAVVEELGESRVCAPAEMCVRVSGVGWSLGFWAVHG